MIKIKNNQTGEERIVPAKQYFELDIDLEKHQIIEWKDVVRVYSDGKNPVSLGIMSRLEAKRYLDSGTNYYLENVPRPDLKTKPVITPEKTTPAMSPEKLEPVIIPEHDEIPAIQESDKPSFFKGITLLGWAAICGLIALIIALWTIL